MSFQGSLKRVQCCSVADLEWERVPQGGGCHAEGSVPEGPKVRRWDCEKVQVSRTQGPLVSWFVLEKAGEILGSQVVLTLVGQQKKFVVDPVFNREPVQLFEGGGDVLPGLGVSKHSGS